MSNVIDIETKRKLRLAHDAPAFEPDFVKVLVTEDDLGAVVRAHLYAEHKLRVLIGKKTGADLARDDRKLNDLIPIARAEQIIDQHQVRALRELNTLRNDFAHRIDLEVSPKLLDRLVSSLEDVIREMYDEAIPEVDVPTTSPGRERKLLRIALCAIDSSLIADWEIW